MPDPRDIVLQQAYADHSRRWQDFLYCYPVISRRSKGLSIGINLNPDKACNFDCIYCQVDRTTPSIVRKVDLAVLRDELATLLDATTNGSIWLESPFNALPPEQHVVRDIAFSGDGEPTTFPQFDEAVRIVADLKRERHLHDTKIVLITDACYLTKPVVAAGLRIMDENNGEIWAKLDAGTQAHYELINRPNYPLSHVLANILETAKARPIVIQSLWMRVHDQPPPDAEIREFNQRLNELLAAGAKLKLIQVYTIVRQTTEAYATSLTHAELDHAAQMVKTAVPIPIETYYGALD
ncbi:MAG: radical SAM protein [Planctomycetes bacterium]|nr:radical SAM protein [Planctomycetota bacterium]